MSERNCKICIHQKKDGCSRWECEFMAKKDCVILVGVPMPKTCAECSFSNEVVEGDDEMGYGVWYECMFLGGGANPGEKLKGCPLREVEE